MDIDTGELLVIYEWSLQCRTVKKGDTRRLKQVSYVTLHMYSISLVFMSGESTSIRLRTYSRDEAMYMYECREYVPGLGLAIENLHVSMCLCRQSELVYKYNCIQMSNILGWPIVDE